MANTLFPTLISALNLNTASASAPLSSSPSSSSTSSDEYLDLRFPLPETPRYVGMLACQRDPLLALLDTAVVRCDKVAPVAAAPAGGKKGKKAVAEPVKDEWEVELHDTVLFPEGGGQPSDIGVLVPLSSAGEAQGEAVNVRQVIRRNLDAVHFVDRPVEVGTRVRAVVDMERRTDLSQQHSGQHLLSAVLEHPPYSLETLSWSLQSYPELCYIELPRTPTAEELAAVEKRCNELIAEGRKMRVRMELATEETGVKLGNHVPENYKDEKEQRPPVQRTVLIDNLDENPCCGTHLPSLTHLRQLFISPFTTSIRGTNARVYFAFGTRALTHLSSTHTHAREAALAVGCAVPDLTEKVKGLVVARTDATRREKRLKEELAGWVGRDVVEKAKEAEAENGGTLALALLREDDATNALDFLTAVAGEVGTRLSVATSSDKDKRQLFLLASGATPGSQTAAASGGAVLIFGSEELVSAAGKKVVETFGKERVKGGGKGRWQGKVTGRWENGDELLLKKILKEVVSASA
ncbi:hypothetical protein JCM6882_005900 [Rhodosporidiobolus microsporus]